MAHTKKTGFLYSAVAGDQDYAPAYDYASRHSLIGRQSTLTSSPDYAVICWRKSDLGVIDSSELRVLDLNVGSFKDLSEEVQELILSTFSELTERLRFSYASLVMNLESKRFSSGQDAAMQSEYFAYIKRVKAAGLGSECFPHIRNFSGCMELSFYPLDYTTESMSKVPLSKLYSALLKVAPEKITPIFARDYDVIIAPDRVMNFQAVRPLPFNTIIKKTERPSRRALINMVNSSFGLNQASFFDKVVGRFSGMLSRG